MILAVAIGLVLMASVVGSLLAKTKAGLLIAAIAWLFLGIVWGLIVTVSATPCGFSGDGPLSATPECPVQAIHVVSALVGGGSVVALVTASFGGFGYAMTGAIGSRALFRMALVVALILAFALVVANANLPRIHPSD